MDSFTITVTGITRREYLQACRENARRLYLILAVAMVIICGVIMLATGNVSIPAVAGPVLVYLIALGAYEVLTRVNYKGQLEQFDPVEYRFDGLRWQVKAGSEQVSIDWRGTSKLHKTRDCLFLYNNDASSNLIPLRLVTPEQEALIFRWYRNTRKLARQYEREQMRAQRTRFRQQHQDLRLGASGPAWGPLKRKRHH